MDYSTSDCQLNQGEVDFEFESNEVLESLCVVDDQFVPKVGMTFNTLEDAAKFYKDYAKAAGRDAQTAHGTKHVHLSYNRENEEASIRPSKTYQSFIAAAGGHRELNFIEKDMRNYITREVRNVLEQEDAKEFRKYLLRMKEKNQNFFFELKLEDDQSIKLAFWADARSRAAFEYFGDVISFDTTYNTNK
ncbi:Protein FAR1-RELATED SEQUENCE [Arachis hypogaea]|nr:Protein FAR1-RELATED SEQUENCE [Arachis hypogaea]